MLIGDAVDMGADCRDAVGIGAAKAELHAQADVPLRPMGAVAHGGVVAAVQAAVGHRARDDLPFVEMGVRLDQRRQDNATFKIHRAGGRGRACRGQAGDAASVDGDIDQRAALAVCDQPLRWRDKQCQRHARARQYVALALRPREV